jgi:hypothetical protein
MRSFCCGSISAKSDVVGAACHSASSSSFASASPVSIDVGSSPTVAARWPVAVSNPTGDPALKKAEAVVAASSTRVGIGGRCAKMRAAKTTVKTSRRRGRG